MVQKKRWFFRNTIILLLFWKLFSSFQCCGSGAQQGNNHAGVLVPLPSQLSSQTTRNLMTVTWASYFPSNPDSVRMPSHGHVQCFCFVSPGTKQCIPGIIAFSGLLTWLTVVLLGLWGGHGGSPRWPLAEEPFPSATLELELKGLANPPSLTT